jgi:Bifunctional DNA primase/polymerase, N-terminal
VVRLGCLTMRDCKVVQQSDRRPCVAMRSRQDTVDGWWAIHERGDCDCSLMVAAATAAVLEAWRAGMSAFETALFALAAAGIPSFPCRIDKSPACCGGFKAAMADSDGLRDLLRHRWGLIGVATDKASGLDVTDIDSRHGGNEWLAKNRHRLPATRAHRTRSSGVDMLFHHQHGMRNSAGRIAPGIDVRSSGGYVIWWPAAGLPLVSETPVAWCPTWLRKLAPPPFQTPQIARSRPAVEADAGWGPTPRYSRAALERVCEAIARAPIGAQESTLNSEAYSVGRLVASGHMPRPPGFRLLDWAALRMANDPGGRPWLASEIREKIGRGFRDAERHPRVPDGRVA